MYVTKPSIIRFLLIDEVSSLSLWFLLVSLSVFSLFSILMAFFLHLLPHHHHHHHHEDVYLTSRVRAVHERNDANTLPRDWWTTTEQHDNQTRIHTCRKIVLEYAVNVLYISFNTNRQRENVFYVVCNRIGYTSSTSLKEILFSAVYPRCYGHDVGEII